jgi:5-methylthioadenosine/S-adenosylhomocysteine deaminase
VTTLVDWAHITNTPQHADASIQALTDVGIRGIYAHGTPNNADTAAWYQHSELPHPKDIRRVREQLLPGDDGLVTMAMAARPPHIVSRDVMVHDWTVARELGLRVTCDGGLGGGSWSGVLWGDGGHQPIVALIKEGLLDERTTLVHCNNLPDEDLKAVAEAGAHISISPDSEMHVGHGLPVTGRAFAAGIRPALSTDIQIQVAGDLFGAMRSLIAAERGRLGTLAYAAGVGPDDWSISTRDVLGFATIQGAKATGLDRQVGTITPGKRADLCVLRSDALNLRPTNNAIGIAVLQAHPGNVSEVLVDGRFVKRGGRMLADTDAAIRLADESRDYLFEAAGLVPGWGYQPDLQPEWRW